jgi:hypothetical protein
VKHVRHFKNLSFVGRQEPDNFSENLE